MLAISPQWLDSQVSRSREAAVKTRGFFCGSVYKHFFCEIGKQAKHGSIDTMAMICRVVGGHGWE
jgi:hypothetical protein